MSIDKFGSHLFGKDNNKTNLSANNEHIIKVVDLSSVKLSYNLVLPFIGNYNENAKVFQLLQDKRLKYEYPFETSTIIKAEFPKNDINMTINGMKIRKPEGLILKKGDILSFHRSIESKLSGFYGELLIKCTVQVEK